MPLPLVGVGIWAVLSSVLGRLVASRLGFWIAAALGTLGLQLVTQTAVVGPAIDLVSTKFSGFPADLLAWVAFLNVDKMITIILSAYAAAATLSAVKLRRKAA